MNESLYPIENEKTAGVIRGQPAPQGQLQRTQRRIAAQHEAILAAIADGVVVTDEHNTVILTNRAAHRVLNLGSFDVVSNASAFVGQPVSTLFAACSPESQASLSQAIESISTNAVESSARDEPVHLLLSDKERVVDVSLTPILDKAEALSGTVIVLRDVTAEKQVAQAKNEFVSLVSHELRTPMTSIKGYTDLMLKGAVGALNDQQRDFMTVVKSNVDRMAELVSDLLDVSRLEAGRLRLTRERLDLAGVVYEISDELTETLRQRELTLEFDLAPGLPPVYADRTRVIQVLLNLLSNAYRYTPAGGTITISIRVLDGEVRVDVADTGIGIPEQDREPIFERFYRADHPVVRQQAGTGLGLPIAKSLIEMHSGRLWLRSKVGQGSTFSFTLPLYTEDSEPLIAERCAPGEK